MSTQTTTASTHQPPDALPQTLGELKAAGYTPRSIKREVRENLITALREKRDLFPGIVGFQQTVIPRIINALLAEHDIILLGLRGQAKTRIARQIVSLLDEWLPVLPGFPLNEDPLQPVSRGARELVEQQGDATPIAWLHRSQRYGEKLATPDVTMSDLIGDIDPIKAATLKLDLSNEDVIHFGIIPRTNRGIFCINELPDLSPRIQVGLLNIMQERDIQIRGFPVRLPVDTLMVFTANPEDYTNRGSIITPLKDRIESQIHTHYPEKIEHAMEITAQEAWVGRDSGVHVHVPRFLLEAVEEVAFAGRASEFLDQSSGVSARLPISLLENLVSNAERRGLMLGEERISARPVDFQQAISAVTGKVELVYQGEQEGAQNVARHLVGKGLKRVFERYLPDPNEGGGEGEDVFGAYSKIINHFNSGGKIELADVEATKDVEKKLLAIPDLKRLAEQHLELADGDLELTPAMEFVLEGLHQSRMLGKDDLDGRVNYYDALGDLMSDIEEKM